MIKIRFDIKSEDGNYLLEDIDDSNFVNNRIEVTPNELPELMKELADETGDDKMLDTLRFCYSYLEPNSISFDSHTDKCIVSQDDEPF